MKEWLNPYNSFNSFGPYNEIIEKVFIEDGMCRNFP